MYRDKQFNSQKKLTDTETEEVIGRTVIADLFQPLHSRQLERRWIGSLVEERIPFMDQTAERNGGRRGSLFFFAAIEPRTM